VGDFTLTTRPDKKNLDHDCKHYKAQSTMASVYKSLSKANTTKAEGPANGVKKNKQRVLILSSRGITYR